ncbi:hypothetical protein HMPREF1579_00971 [Gardnerella vaginalis JCP8066]|nr:hypothetical protein HMPREF1579_00971 [Gardnerella vaginalis JCP8066]
MCTNTQPAFSIIQIAFYTNALQLPAFVPNTPIRTTKHGKNSK